MQAPMKLAAALEDGLALWSEWYEPEVARGCPALFLDRDGVLVEEVHFLSRPQDVRLCPGVGPAIARARAAGLQVIVVTNQSGIARGLFGWEAFAAVQAEIGRQLADEGARLTAVLACGFHEQGLPRYNVAGHPWRKPSPGMLLRAREVLGIELARSHIVGDRLSDLEAGRNASLRSGVLVETGYGGAERADLEELRPGWAAAGFATTTASDATAAIDRLVTEWFAG